MTKSAGDYQSILLDLGLDQDPFGSERRVDAYYASPALKQRIDLIRHLLELGRQLVLITGPAGAGKSSLLDLLLEHQPGTWLTLRVAGGPTLNADALLKRVAARIGVPAEARDGQDSAIALVRAKLTELDRAGKVVVLAVDDADLLPSDTHRALVRLAHSEQPSAELKIVLTADHENPALLQGLRQDRPEPASVHVVLLPEFSPAQTRALIEHRLRLCGLRDALPLDDAAVARIHRDAGGIPGKIVVLARQALVETQSPPPRWHVPAVVRRLRLAHAGAAAGLVLLGIVLLRGHGPDGEPAELVALAPPLPTAPAPTVMREPALDAEPAWRPTAAEPPPVAGAHSAPTVGTTVDTPAEGLEPPPTGTAATGEPPPAGPLPAADAGTDRTGSTSKAAAGPARGESAAAARPPRPATGAAERSPGPAHPAPAYTLAWLRSQAPSGYVLQLFGVRDEVAARAFIERHALDQETAIYESDLDGKPWYVVFYGYYRDRDSAQAAIARLPPALRQLEPWARPLRNLPPAPSGQR